MKITYYGHSCLLVETDGYRLLFDPFITPNPRAAGVILDEIEADYVLLSHGHEDHVADAGRLLASTGATLIANFEIVSWFGRKGLGRAHPLNLGGSHLFPFGRVHMVNAVHSSVLPDGTYGGNPGGYVIESAEGTFYFSGDTALTYDMKSIAERYKLAWAALCIGDNFTMGPTDAAIAANWVGAPRVIGIHYDTFPPIEIDHDEARRRFSAQGVNLILAPIGGSLTLA
jgi:L-ascorbate metabolism protein UlaG (beta-lactamase superfamily)